MKYDTYSTKVSMVSLDITDLYIFSQLNSYIVYIFFYNETKI